MSQKNIPQSDLLDMYAAGPDRLEAFIKKVPESSLNMRSAEDEWSIQEIIHHIVDGDDIWNTCIKAVLGNPEGEFALQWYWDVPQLTWSKKWNYGTRSIETSVALFRANRAHIVELLRLSQVSWEQTISIRWPGDKGLSKISIEEVVKMHVNHLSGHLEDMTKILSKSGT